jgi:prevent-host-death family protein
MIDTVSITDLKQNTAGVISRIKGSFDPILVLQRSEVAAVLLDPEKFKQMELLIERLEDLEDTQALRDRAKEETVSSESVANQLGL